MNSDHRDRLTAVLLVVKSRTTQIEAIAGTVMVPRVVTNVLNNGWYICLPEHCSVPTYTRSGSSRKTEDMNSWTLTTIPGTKYEVYRSVGDRSENDRRPIVFDRRPWISDLRSFGRSFNKRRSRFDLDSISIRSRSQSRFSNENDQFSCVSCTYCSSFLNSTQVFWGKLLRYSVGYVLQSCTGYTKHIVQLVVYICCSTKRI